VPLSSISLGPTRDTLVKTLFLLTALLSISRSHDRPPEVQSVDNPAIHCRQPFTAGYRLTLRVRNERRRRVTATVIPSVHLSTPTNAFWAPFTLSQTPLPTNSRHALSLGPKQELRFSLNLEDLLWARTISSTWPFEALDRVVARGTYRVTVELFGEDSSGHRWVATGACGFLQY
jgi:hypothetical protein